MIIIGLTGSIGMGKTTAAKILQQMGCAIYNSDACVHRALEPYGKAFEAVALAFPKAWDKKTHRINRKILGKIVFNDHNAREMLESILHPIVWADQKKFLLAQRRFQKQFSVLDIPLLFETGADRRCDVTAVVTAPFSIQYRRVMARPNMTEEKFFNILETQMPSQEKCARADFIIPTGQGKACTYRSLRAMLRQLKEPSIKRYRYA